MIASAGFGLRTYGSLQLLRSAYAVGAPEVSNIRPWMTLRYVSTTYRASEKALIERLALAPDTDPETSLDTLAEREGSSRLQYVQRVQQAVAAIASVPVADPAAKRAG